LATVNIRTFFRRALISAMSVTFGESLTKAAVSAGFDRRC
jgi:hypothetical protein